MIKLKFTEDVIFKNENYRANEEYSFNNSELEELLKLNIKIVFLPISQRINDFKKKPVEL